METEKLTDNEVIAKFMGMSSFKTEHDTFWHPTEVCSPTNWQYHSLHLDLYHKSWDWLMPVVEKIHDLYKEAFPPGPEFVRRILAKEDLLVEPYMDVVAIPIATPITEVYAAVIKFIHWYNPQTPQPNKD